MVKPNDFSSSFNTLMVVQLAFRKLGQLFLQLQAYRCGHGGAVRVSWVHINPISARINAGKLAGHSPATAPSIQGSESQSPTANTADKAERLRVIDWEQPENNDFLLVNQFSVTGALYTCRPELVGFVNGLPLVVIELKKPGVPARAAFDENLTHYKQQISALFWFNGLLIASNGTEPRRLAYGRLGAVLRVEAHRARG